MLSFICRSGLFLMPLDEERNWYRYHPLFAEFLQRRRADERMDERELHARASGWFWAHDLPVEAVEHALRSGDVEHAARLLESRCLDMTYTGSLQLVCQFATRIPAQVLQRFPRILLSVSWMLTLNMRLEEARATLALAAQQLQELGLTAALGNEELRGLNYLLQHRQMILAVAEDDAPRVEHDCRYLLEAFPEQRHPYLAGNITAQLLYAQREQYQLADLDRLAATAQGILARSSFSFASIALHASIGPSLFFAGRTDAALRALELGLAEAVRFGGHKSPLAALPALPLSEIVYENNELARAARLIAC